MSDGESTPAAAPAKVEEPSSTAAQEAVDKTLNNEKPNGEEPKKVEESLKTEELKKEEDPTTDDKKTEETIEEEQPKVEAASAAPAAGVSEKKPEEVEAEAADEAKAETTDKASKDPPNMLRTTARSSTDYRKNNKFDATALPDTDDHNLIRTQVEFYFSDSNLPTDAYMLELTGGQENKPVKLSKITSFKRMRRFKPYEAVVAALKDSKILNLAGADGEEELTRKVPFDPSKNSSESRTVYVKGFGDEQPSTQFDLEAFFTKFGALNAVRLRRTNHKLFKGSAWVEFQDEETANKFLALDPKPQWQGHDLKIMARQAYIAEKNEGIRDGKIALYTKGRGRGNFRGRGRGRGGKGGDSDDWKKRRESDQRQGFRDRGRGGRGGRGGGRGGRGGRRDRDGANDQDEKPIDATHDEKAQAAEPAPETATNGKRAHDDEGGAEEQPPAKKVDVKTEDVAAQQAS